jgi:hypothetical protein
VSQKDRVSGLEPCITSDFFVSQLSSGNRDAKPFHRESFENASEVRHAKPDN